MKIEKKMINLIIGIFVIIVASYLLYPILHGETTKKTKIMVSVTILIGLANIVGEFAI